MKSNQTIRYKIFLKEFNKRLYNRIDTNTLKRSNCSKNIIIYCQLSLWRSYKLYKVILNSLKDDNFDGLLLSLRAQLEIIGGIGNLLYQNKRLSNSDISSECFDNFIEQILLGSRHESITTEYKSISVLTLIQNTDKLGIFGDENKTFFNDLYNKYSEFCHPNSLSLLANIETINRGIYKIGNNKFGNKELQIADDVLLLYPILLTLFDTVVEI